MLAAMAPACGTMAYAVDLFLVDAFASEPFTGNPAAVCLLEEKAPVRRMQAVAAELRAPATSFVRRGGETSALASAPCP